MEMTYPTNYLGKVRELPACCLNCTYHTADGTGDSYCTFNEGFEFIRAPRYHSCTDHCQEKEAAK